jgi:hypothetical protein
LSYFGAIPTFRAFLAALSIITRFRETGLAWLLAAAFDHAVLPGRLTPRAFRKNIALPIRVILWLT